MTTIATIRPALAERQNNYDPRTHTSSKKDGAKPPKTPTSAMKLRVQQTSTVGSPDHKPFMSAPSPSPSPAKTPKRKSPKKPKKQAQTPVLKTDDFAAVAKKKVYSASFLTQYKTAGDQTFEPGTAPADLIRLYNEAYEKREQAAKAADLAGVSNNPRPVDMSKTGPVSAPTTPAQKEEEKKKKRNAHVSNTTVKVSKFKIEGDDSFFSKQFTATAPNMTPIKIPARPVFHSSDLPSNKENVASIDAPLAATNKKPSKKLIINKEDNHKNTLNNSTDDAELLRKLTELMQPHKSAQTNTNANVSYDSADGGSSMNTSVISESSEGDASSKHKSQETDARRLTQRQKQIDFGKVTAGYKAYVALVPKCKRKRDDAKTPNKFQVCSKRSWDGQIRKWRRQLHDYDPEGTPLPDDMKDGEEGGDEDDVSVDVSVSAVGDDSRIIGQDEMSLTVA